MWRFGFCTPSQYWIISFVLSLSLLERHFMFWLTPLVSMFVFWWNQNGKLRKFEYGNVLDLVWVSSCFQTGCLKISTISYC